MPDTPPALSPSLEEIAAWHQEEAEIYATGTAVLEEAARPEEAARERAEAKMHADFASALRSLAEEHKALIREVESWRWLHWGKTDASWACPCGNALGAGLDSCPECGALRPRRDRPHAVRLRSLVTPTEGRDG